MNSFTGKIVFWLSSVFVLSFIATATETTAQTKNKPIFQTIIIKPGSKARPRVTPTPKKRVVKKTGKSTPTNLPSKPVNPSPSFRTSIPALANVAIPGYSGILVETLGGRVILQNYPNAAFNPASNVKVATAYAVLKTFGPNYRFTTTIWTDGDIDRSTGTLNGNLYVSGRDPIFNYQHAVSIANALNRMGVTKIDGDLIVTSNFAMRYSRSPMRSGNRLFTTLHGAKRSVAAKRAWNEYIAYSGTKNVLLIPSVFFTGSLYVQSIPSNARPLFRHESTPMREILKAMMIFSNNFLAARLGEMLGGSYAVARKVQFNARVSPFEFSLASSSGLGTNRVTPRAQMRLLRTLRAELRKHGMTFTDIMPVAGVDKGTLARRFNTGFARGSVVGKTGTLGRTDGGVSTLSGEIKTRQGTLLFVIFNQRGSVRRFRNFQNNYISLIQNIHGGAVRLPYRLIPIEKRLSKSRIKYPRGSRYRVEE